MAAAQWRWQIVRGRENIYPQWTKLLNATKTSGRHIGQVIRLFHRFHSPLLPFSPLATPAHLIYILFPAPPYLNILGDLPTPPLSRPAIPVDADKISEILECIYISYWAERHCILSCDLILRWTWVIASLEAKGTRAYAHVYNLRSKHSYITVK